MDRLVVDLPLTALEEAGFRALLEQVELLDAYLLRADPPRMTQVIRVRPRRPGITVDGLKSHPLIQSARLLRTEGEVWVVLVTFLAPPILRRMGGPFLDVFPDRPIEVRKDRIRVAFVGERLRLHRIMEAAQAAGVGFKVVRFEPLDAQAAGPLEVLTPKQRSLLRAAHDMGYFENPRRVRLGELAKLFGLDSSTVMETLRRAERNLLTEVFGGGQRSSRADSSGRPSSPSGAR